MVCANNIDNIYTVLAKNSPNEESVFKELYPNMPARIPDTIERNTLNQNS